MKPIVDIGVLGVTIVMMVAVGMALDARQFLEVARRTWLLVFLPAGPAIVLPVLGYLLISVWVLSPHLNAGIMAEVPLLLAPVAVYRLGFPRKTAPVEPPQPGTIIQ